MIVMDRTEQLTRWWSGRSPAERERARHSADRDVLDEDTRESLLALGVGFVQLEQWKGQEGTWHMPPDVANFIRKQEL